MIEHAAVLGTGIYIYHALIILIALNCKGQ